MTVSLEIRAAPSQWSRGRSWHPVVRADIRSERNLGLTARKSIRAVLNYDVKNNTQRLSRRTQWIHCVFRQLKPEDRRHTTMRSKHNPDGKAGRIWQGHDRHERGFTGGNLDV